MLLCVKGNLSITPVKICLYLAHPDSYQEKRLFKQAQHKLEVRIELQISPKTPVILRSLRWVYEKRTGNDTFYPVWHFGLNLKERSCDWMQSLEVWGWKPVPDREVRAFCKRNQECSQSCLAKYQGWKQIQQAREFVKWKRVGAKKRREGKATKRWCLPSGAGAELQTAKSDCC